MRIVIICFLAVLAISFSSCFDGFGKRVKGNGEMTSITRNPGDFKNIEQKGSLDIIVKKGTKHEVVIEAESNLVEHIETQIEGSKLIIRQESGFNLRPTKHIRIVVTAPAYDGIWSYGSGNIVSEGLISDSNTIELETRGSGNIQLQLQVPDVKASSYGSGDISLSGETRSLSMESAGSGNLKAEDLKAETAEIDMMGSGNATVNASKSLDVSVKGSGDVSYKGTPTIKSDIKGSGTLKSF